MDTAWTDRWNERYRGKEFAYGEAPNEYLKQQIDRLSPGSILFPAEGEGRNAVYAAGLGWKVSAFDISAEGQRKALQLATSRGVKIDYQVGEIESLGYQPGQFDVLALIYAHFPALIKSQLHKTLGGFLRKGGTLIFEAFSKKHIEYIRQNEKVGGPKEIDMLFSIEELQSDFLHYDFEELAEMEVELHEGLFHNGKGSVIHCVARKK